MNYFGLVVIVFSLCLESVTAQIPTQEQCQQADAQLNQVYQQLRGSLNDAQKQQLKQAQRDWIKKRDAFVAANPGNSQGALYQATMQRVEALTNECQKVQRNVNPADLQSRPSEAQASTTGMTREQLLQEALNKYSLGILLINQGNYAKALPLLEKTLEIREKVLGPVHLDTGYSLGMLAEVYRHMGSYERALPLHEKSLAVIEKNLGDMHPTTAIALNNLAANLNDMHHYTESITLHEKALAIREKSLGPEHTDTVQSIINIALTSKNNGNYLKSISLLERALVIREKALGPSHPDTAGVLSSLGVVYMDMGNYIKALSLYERQLAILEKALGAEHPNTATAMSQLAGVYNGMGNYAKALALEERNYRICDKTLGPEHHNTLTALENQSSLNVSISNYSKAQSLITRVLAIREKTLAPDDPKIIHSLNIQAAIYVGMASYKNAVKIHERVLAICEKTYGSEHPNTAAALGNLGSLQQKAGNYSQASKLLEKALKIEERILGPEHPDTLKGYKALALTRYLSGCDLPLVREPLSKVFSARDRLLDRLLLMEEETRLSWQKQDLDYEMVDLLRSEQRTQYILRTKSVVLDSLLEDQKAMKGLGSGSPEMRDLISARLRLGKLAFSMKQEDQDEVALLQSQINAILCNTAGQRVKIGRVRESATITPDTVATTLPQGSMLVEFVQFSDPKIEGAAARCYGALILGRDGDSKFVRIDDAASIDDSIRSLREAILKGDEKALIDQQKLLSEKLWIPVAKTLPDATRKLFIGADGQLNFLSFAALPAPDGGFLAEHFDIAYVGSGRDLARKVTPSDSKSIALFADPVFDRAIKQFSTNALALRSGEVDAFGKIVLPPLPGTKAEEAAVENVARSAGWSPQPNLGEAANKSAVENLKSPGILHLATHGFYLNTLPENGAEGVRGMKVMEAPELLGSKTAPMPKIDPMHASGIALTGAQSTLKAWSEGRVPNPSEDGILTAEEVGALNLEGTWLVTLSACETGVGEARSGEGVFGLRRAFMIAGAQNLLMTLWPVSDEVTPKIMADFYKEALATHDAAGSLARVQREWLVKLRNEKGLMAAVRDVGPFAMVVMANPNSKIGNESKQPAHDNHINQPGVDAQKNATEKILTNHPSGESFSNSSPQFYDYNSSQSLDERIKSLHNELEELNKQ